MSQVLFQFIVLLSVNFFCSFFSAILSEAVRAGLVVVPDILWGTWNIETKMHGRKANECSIFLQIIRVLYFIYGWSRETIFFGNLCNWNSLL